MFFKNLKLSYDLDCLAEIFELRDIMARNEAKKLRRLLFENKISSSHIPTQDMEFNRTLDNLRRYNRI